MKEFLEYAHPYAKEFLTTAAAATAREEKLWTCRQKSKGSRYGKQESLQHAHGDPREGNTRE